MGSKGVSVLIQGKDFSFSLMPQKSAIKIRLVMRWPCDLLSYSVQFLSWRKLKDVS